MYQRNTLALWRICPEIVEISRRMLFSNSCRVYRFVLDAFLLNLSPKSSQDVKSRKCRGQRPRVSTRPRKLCRSVSKLGLSVITDLHYESLGFLLINVFTGTSVMQQQAWTRVQCWTAFFVSAKHGSAGKYHRKFLSSGDECYKNACTQGHKIVNSCCRVRKR